MINWILLGCISIISVGFWIKIPSGLKTNNYTDDEIFWGCITFFLTYYALTYLIAGWVGLLLNTISIIIAIIYIHIFRIKD